MAKGRKPKTEEVNPVHIINNYYFTADKYCYTLVERVTRTKEDGSKYESYSSIGFYGSINVMFKALCEYYTRSQISQGEFANLKEVVDFYVSTANKLETLVRIQTT